MGVLAGRALQGAGAVSAAVTALLADLTRDVVRTKAMALVGASIGLVFALSLVVSPVIAAHIGLSGLFVLTAVLALLVAFGLVISFQVIVFPLVRAAVPPDQAGRALSAANLSFFLGAAVLQGLSGLMAGWGGVAAALATFAGGLVLCSVGFLLLHPRR
jgi:MFS family permease